MLSSKQVKDPLKKHFTHSRSSLYIALEDLDLEFSKNEVEIMVIRWFEGWFLSYIADELKRDLDELAVLLADLTERALLTSRSRGIHTSTWREIPSVYGARIQKFLKKNPKNYYAFQDSRYVEFLWDERDTPKFELLWNAGYSLEEISLKLKRNKLDVALLVLDRARKGFIECREGGLEGKNLHDSKKVVRKRNGEKSAVS
jgi:hypothetical protein